MPAEADRVAQPGGEDFPFTAGRVDAQQCCTLVFVSAHALHVEPTLTYSLPSAAKRRVRFGCWPPSGKPLETTLSRAERSVLSEVGDIDSFDGHEVNPAVANLDAMQLRDTRNDSLRVDDPVAIDIAHHHQVARATLRYVHGAVLRDRQHARILETFGKTMDAEACRHRELRIRSSVGETGCGS